MIKHDAEVNGEARFTMLELLREYALEQLAKSGEAEVIRRRHAEYFVALAEAAELPLLDGRQIVWLTRLSSNHDNLRAALKWAQEQGAVEITLRLIGPTWRYWQTNNHVAEGRAWLIPALAAEAFPFAPARMLANAYHAAGALALYQYDYRAGLRLIEQGAAWAKVAEDDLLIGITLNGCSAASGNLGDFARRIPGGKGMHALARDRAEVATRVRAFHAVCECAQVGGSCSRV